MARRSDRIGGGRPWEMDFGEDDQMQRLAIAMKLLGMSDERRAQDIDERKQEALERYYEGQTTAEQEKLGITRSEAEANARLRELQEQGISSARTAAQEEKARDIQYKSDALAAAKEAEGMKARAELIKEAMGDPSVPWATKEQLMSGFDPQFQGTFRNIADARMKAAVARLLPNIEAAYKGGNTAEVLKTMFADPATAEALKSPEIPWGKYNAEMPAPKGSALSRIWQALSGGGSGEGAAAPPATVSAAPAVTPRPAFGNYGPVAAAAEAAPWRYGVGTAPIPEEMIPAGVAPEAPAFNLADLIAKIMPQAAPAAVGTTEAERLPWLYGGQRWTIPEANVMYGPPPARIDPRLLQPTLEGGENYGRR